MGCIDTITYDKFPKQKDENYKYPEFKVGSRVEVCYHFDTSKCHYGTIVRDDLEEHDKQIRADAIDEFVKRLKAECRKHYVDCDPYFGGIVDSILYEDDIDEIAEELKAGGKNEWFN